MNPLTKKQKIILLSVILGVGLVCGGFVIAGYNAMRKSTDVYTQALKDYNEKKLQNSYYLFSKVAFFSDLKPLAIYRQAKCAEDLGDNESAVKQYQFLFTTFPSHKLSLRSKYAAARLLVDNKTDVAKKYFSAILENYPESDYGIASEYFLGKILLNSREEITDAEKLSVKDYYISYLTKAPAGRWAYNILNDLSTLVEFLTSEDYLLMAKSSYLLGDYKRAQEFLYNVPLENSWALDAKVSYAQKNYSRVRYVTEYGISQHSSSVKINELQEAADLYLRVESDDYVAASKLYSYPDVSGKDYLLNLKCQNSPKRQQYECYRDLYLNYPTSDFSGEALANIFMIQVRDKDYSKAWINGRNYLDKYKSQRFSPMILYWMGKIAEKTDDKVSYTKYYRDVILKYPDSYYAYRAYLKLNGMTGSIINNYINEKSVEYPYASDLTNTVELKLAQIGDYELLSELNEDAFIKSWIYYQKGDYSHSMLVARDAMEKMEEKPDKYDLRWRLVYPIDYYETIKEYAGAAGNNSPLILSIVREESYFNPRAYSGVGAIGLMQLMPSTAKEIALAHGITINSVEDLMDSTLNIKLGNYYYAMLKSMLSGLDISSVAAYNGGIGSVNRWKKSLYYNDTDEFVEQIPYPETKDYVKKVFRSYWNYIRLYTGNEE